MSHRRSEPAETVVAEDVSSNLGMAPENSLLVSESGIFSYDDIERVKDAGAKAILVGESLMRQDDVADAVRKLLNIQ